MKLDRLIAPEHRAGGDPKKKGISDLAGGTSNRHANRILHVHSFTSQENRLKCADVSRETSGHISQKVEKALKFIGGVKVDLYPTPLLTLDSHLRTDMPGKVTFEVGIYRGRTPGPPLSLRRSAEGFGLPDAEVATDNLIEGPLHIGLVLREDSPGVPGRDPTGSERLESGSGEFEQAKRI